MKKIYTYITILSAKLKIMTLTNSNPDIHTGLQQTEVLTSNAQISNFLTRCHQQLLNKVLSAWVLKNDFFFLEG